MIKRLVIILFLLHILVILTNAAIPVTYNCCINYTYSGVLLDGFDNSSQWTVAGVGASKDIDTINFKEGKQGLKLIAINGNRSYIDKKINNNFSDTNNFALWLYVRNVSTFNYINIYFTSTGSVWSKYFLYSKYGGFNTGWNELIFDKNSFKNTQGEDWNNPMNMIRIAIYPKVGYNTNVTVDDLRYDIYGKRAKIILSFDDGNIDTYNNAFPILDSNNQSAVTFIITSTIGTKGKMNLSNLRDLQSADWDISSHTVDHPHLTMQNDTMQYLELNNSYDWLVANKFQKSAGIIAYPYGEFNDKVIDKVRQRYILGRSTVEGSVQQHFIPTDDSSMYIQRVINVFNDTTIQSIENKINDSINSKLLGILVFHNIVDSDPTRYQNTKQDLQAISDYLKNRNTDVDVVTFSDYLIPNINKYTPVINKTARIYSNGTVELITKNKYDEYMPNMTVVPSSGFIDVNVVKYSDQLIKFSESNSTSRVLYSIGDLTPYSYYSVKIYLDNDTIYQDFDVLSNSTGYLNYNLAGSKNSRYQLIQPIILLNYIIGTIIVMIIVMCEIVYYLRKKRNTNVRNPKI
jgi:peptidoglycan/xylan/chitin deacetylase (PgdA/CDA1 family)